MQIFRSACADFRLAIHIIIHTFEQWAVPQN